MGLNLENRVRLEATSSLFTTSTDKGSSRCKISKALGTQSNCDWCSPHSQTSARTPRLDDQSWQLLRMELSLNATPKYEFRAVVNAFLVLKAPKAVSTRF